MRVFVVTKERADGSDQVRIRARLEWGSQETLDPQDVGLLSVDWIQLQTTAHRAGTLLVHPVASLSPVLGTPGDSGLSISRGRRGSGVTLTWLRWVGTAPAQLGTRQAGTKSAWADIVGRN